MHQSQYPENNPLVVCGIVAIEMEMEDLRFLKWGVIKTRFEFFGKKIGQNPVQISLVCNFYPEFLLSI